MIQKVADFYELNKILREEVLNQTSLPNDHVLNGLSINGADLEKRLESEIFVPFKINDSFIVFELSPRDSSSDVTQTIDEDLDFVSSFTFKLVIYGKSSANVAKIIKSRFESEEVRQILFNKGVYIESITNSQPFNEFINNTMWLRADVAIEISCETVIEKVTQPFEFENLGELKVDAISNNEEPPTPPTEWQSKFNIEIDEESGNELSFHKTVGSYLTDWGDGTVDSSNSHIYENYGQYIIKISGIISGEDSGEFFDEGKSSIKSVEFYNDVIGENALRLCINLESVEFSGIETSIPYGAFDECRSLYNITIPENVTNIGSYSFSGCESLRSVTFSGTSLIDIDNHAFSSCSSLASIIIPSGTKRLEYNCFYGCSNLSRIDLPSSINYIGNYAFSDTDSCDIYYNGTRDQWNEIEKDYYWDIGIGNVYCIDD